MIKIKGLTSEDINGFLDQGTELQGELRFRDTFRVDGKVKGSGLGLTIAREYAIAQSGRIEVLDRMDGQRGVRFLAAA